LSIRKITVLAVDGASVFSLLVMTSLALKKTHSLATDREQPI